MITYRIKYPFMVKDLTVLYRVEFLKSDKPLDLAEITKRLSITLAEENKIEVMTCVKS